jgi:glycerol-3-phosphate cytidylyltransferase
MGAAARVGYAPGVYDLFHVGHLNLLRNARGLCERLVAGVLTDELATRAKGTPPVVPFEERIDIVRSIRYVDEAATEDVPHKLQMWERLRFDVIVKGDDWQGTPAGDRLEADCATVGVEVLYVPYTRRTSSTQLRRVIDRELGRLAAGVDTS